MANSMNERIAEIAVDLREEGETMTFNELADKLDQDHRLMGVRVGGAYNKILGKGRKDEADAIAESFTNEDGEFAY